MNLEFDRAEAFMALGLVTIAADGEILTEEMGCLQDVFEMLDILAIPDKAEFECQYLEIFESTFEKLYTAFPSENLVLDDAQLDDFLITLLEVISQEERGKSIELAMRVALADGLEIQEEKIIDQLQKISKVSADIVFQIKESCNYPIR